MAAAALVFAVAAGAAGAAAIPLGQKANGRSAYAKVRDTLVITLPANASTGYSWRFVSQGGSLLQLPSARYMPAAPDAGAPRPGAPGKHVARLAVRSPGRASVSPVYARQTNPPSTPAGRFAVTVVITR